jgi:hypothetical protein
MFHIHLWNKSLVVFKEHSFSFLPSQQKGEYSLCALGVSAVNLPFAFASVFLVLYTDIDMAV